MLKMPPKKIILHCPYCGWRFETSRPDDFHKYGSVSRPKESEVIEDIEETVQDCRNPKCLKPITVYWFEPKPFFKVV